MRLQLIALLVVAAVAAAACGTSDTSTATETRTVTATTTPAPSTSAATSTPAAAATACDELKGAVADGTCTVHEESADYTVDMTFPADYPDQASIVDVLTRQRDGFLDLISDRPGPPNPYALDITGKDYRSGDAESGTVSVVFEEYVNVGGAHPTTNYDALTYDLATKTPITVDTLFTPGSDPTATLDPIVQDDFRQLLDGADIGPNPIGLDMYRAFALTDDAVVFFLGQGVWAFSAAGPREVSVPRADLESILA